MYENLSPGQGACSARRPALRVFLNESAFLLCDFQGASVCWTMGTGSILSVPGGRVLMSRREMTGRVTCACMHVRRQGCSIPGPHLYLQSPPQVTHCSIPFHRKPGFGGLLCHSSLTLSLSLSHRSARTCGETSCPPPQLFCDPAGSRTYLALPS